ncbi:MAG: class I SAM-dependent methyltransferase [Candidatus Pacearchaeota archaeon]|nr:class I SAM-dependent methyltransferase [Candidatus Pacearchaeota archaeon]
MDQQILKRNADFSDNYKQKDWDKIKIPEMIDCVLKESDNILDLGCGEGQIITAILEKYPHKSVWGVEISPRRVEELKQAFPSGKFFCEDVCNTSLQNNFFDLAISTQVIEHLEDDKTFVKECKRILKEGGYLYVDSVIKKPWAIYKYRYKRRFVLDPTHEREYSSQDDFLRLFKDDFRIISIKTYPVKRRLSFLTIPIPGYYIVEGLFKKIR